MVTRKCIAAAFAPWLLALTFFSPFARGEENDRNPCPEDVMLVFDGSGSMSGNEQFGIGSVVTRIDKVREALAKVLPEVSPLRNIGLVTIGPGEFNKCDDARLAFGPQPDAGERIMTEVNAISPSGRTPLAVAVEEAAKALDYRSRPGIIVVLTDGDDTCGGEPCKLVKTLKAEAAKLTIHVIGYRVRDWIGEKGYFESRCLADDSGGLYITADTSAELVAALRKTLGCPFITDRRSPSDRKHALAGPVVRQSGIRRATCAGRSWPARRDSTASEREVDLRDPNRELRAPQGHRCWQAG